MIAELEGGRFPAIGELPEQEWEIESGGEGRKDSATEPGVAFEEQRLAALSIYPEVHSAHSAIVNGIENLLRTRNDIWCGYADTDA